MDINLRYTKENHVDNTNNRRNAHSSKSVKKPYEDLDIEVPRDRESNFEPIIISKNSRYIAGMQDKVISLYTREERYKYNH